MNGNIIHDRLTTNQEEYESHGMSAQYLLIVATGIARIGDGDRFDFQVYQPSFRRFHEGRLRDFWPQREMLVAEMVRRSRLYRFQRISNNSTIPSLANWLLRHPILDPADIAFFQDEIILFDRYVVWRVANDNTNGVEEWPQYRQQQLLCRQERPDAFEPLPFYPVIQAANRMNDALGIEGDALDHPQEPQPGEEREQPDMVHNDDDDNEETGHLLLPAIARPANDNLRPLHRVLQEHYMETQHQLAVIQRLIASNHQRMMELARQTHQRQQQGNGGNGGPPMATLQNLLFTYSNLCMDHGRLEALEHRLFDQLVALQFNNDNERNENRPQTETQ